MGWTPLHTACRDGDIKRLGRCVNGIKWLVSRDWSGTKCARGVQKESHSHHSGPTLRVWRRALTQCGLRARSHSM